MYACFDGADGSEILVTVGEILGTVVVVDRLLNKAVIFATH